MSKDMEKKAALVADEMMAMGEAVSETGETQERTIRIQLGEVDGKPYYACVTIQARKMQGYESDVDPEIAHAPNWWPKLTSDARAGIFDEELFRDMASFAFEDFVAAADDDSVTRKNAYLALAIKEFCDVEANISEEFEAAQLLAEALCTQACIGWQKIDEEVSGEKLVVFKDSEKVLVGMAPVDLTPLLL